MSRNDGLTPPDDTGVWLYPADGPVEGRMATPAEADAILGKDMPRDDDSIRRAWHAQVRNGGAR